MGGPGSGKKPRVYPPEIVDLATGLYQSGATVVEVQAALPAGYKAQLILERHLPQRRGTAKRDQRGVKNDLWKGDRAGYKALHLRVASQRGKPSLCVACGKTEGRFEWANLTGHYADIHDYIRLCTGCHRRMDAYRRNERGEPLSARAKGVMPNA